ncbi:SARP family transcriptional regulator [Actinomadura sp. NBRC 104412]|uniref:BTAD domain-containing putative transcriptional regulator n=1 Tax=Actinomadura sp. NBRC 104412 TaxID=3032203 RepID=UPI0024A4FDF5|nr:BTAD domain-containing putative transcriptional regulator [Actinomadura sp. NBRC 104412]GLZ05972.1 SARP family transcriptional regulator [Actinomadura sp. NBRC 104412]
MRVRILGPLQVEADGAIVRIGGLRLRALLARLALDAGRPVPQESLCQALWPEEAPENPSHALHSLVTRLRRALPEGSLVLRSEGYCLDVPSAAVDAACFEQLAGQGRQAFRDGRLREASVHLREALGLWRGPALADLSSRFPYAANTAVRLEELRLNVLEDRIDADLKLGADPASLAAELDELTAAHPFRERLRGLLINALHLDGRQPEAFTAYEHYRRFLADELGTDPGPDLQDLHLAVLRGTRSPRGNLRAPLTSFIGREREQARLRGLLAENRLVTLVGPGGVGKTRLATSTVTEGWFVDLAPVSDPEEVPRAVAAALELHESHRPGTLIDRLTEALGSSRTLLILDNCEHVIGAAARLADDLLGRCPSLTILATSREPLAITGEALLPVPPLGEDSAVRLFLDRARAAQPGFRPDPRVAAICSRLDGLPLAIELAAARLRSMPLDHLAARLDDRFRVLTNGSRTALPRHQTLRGVVAWSWDLLNDTERDAAERLAVFPATFAAEHAGTPLEILDALVEKSLLQLDGTRYRMLDTIREYGLERLTETGRLEPARHAFLARFLDLAEQAEPHLRGPGQLRWLSRLNAERDNLVAALRHACDSGDTGSAVRLAAALSPYWTIQGDHTEATHRLRTVLSMPGEAPARPKALFGLLLNATFAGELSEIPAGGPPAEGPLAAHVQALSRLGTDDMPAGLRALEPYLVHPDAWTRAMTWLIRSFLNGASNGSAVGSPVGSSVQARRDLSEAVTAFRRSGDRWGLSVSLASAAFAASATGDFDAAATALEESTRVAAELGPDNQQRIWLAMIRVHTGDLEKAESELRAVMADATSADHTTLARLVLADLARHRGELDEAAHHLSLANPTDVPSQVLFLSSQGHLDVARGDLDAAEDHLTQALSLAATMPDMPMVAVLTVGLAHLLHRQGAATPAAELLGAAHALRGGPDTRHPDVRSLTDALRGTLGPGFEAAYDKGRSHPAPLDLVTGLRLSPESGPTARSRS